MMPDRAHQFLLSWIQALNHQGVGVEPLCAPDVRVSRYGWDAERDVVVQHLAGTGAVREWLALLRPVCQFSLDGEIVQEAGGQLRVRYRIVATDDFVGGGTWRLQLDDAGRLSTLEHRPDDLAVRYR